MPEDRPSPWSRPEPTSPHLGWAPASPPPSATPTPQEAPTTMYAPASPVQVHLTTPAASGGGLAVVGAVLSGLALVVALLALAVSGLTVFAFAGATGGGYGLRGTIAPDRGGDVTGPALAEEVATKVTEDGGDPEGITCPSTAKVAQNVTTVCHGLDFGMTSTFVVFFEDKNGAYTLLEI